MKILIVSEDIPYAHMGGLAKHTLNLARALVQAGHEVDLLGNDQHPLDIAGDEGQFGGRFFGELTGYFSGWKERKLGMFMPPRRIWLARHFARIILRHAPRYDVIHYHGHVPNVARHIPMSVNFVQTRHDQGSDCMMHTRFRNGAVCEATDPVECASCITQRPNALQRAVSAMAVKSYRRQVADSFRRHKTVFVSDMLQRNLARTLGAGPWGITIHHFVDRDDLDRARASAAESPLDAIRIFVAGKICASKGIELFLRELAPQLPAYMQVTIAGDGPDAPRLRREYEGNRIFFLGWCSPQRTLDMAARASVIVVPSIWEEPFGSTTLEGLLLGKPTFALARGGTPELAAYAAEPGQLRLYDDMHLLVRDLVLFNRPQAYPRPPAALGGSGPVVEQLLELYRSAPGHILD